MEDSFINTFTDWSAYEADGSDGFCYDAHGPNFESAFLLLYQSVFIGFSYHTGVSIISCFGCMKFTCSSRPCHDRDGSEFKVFWTLESIVSECCQDCEGATFPPNKAMSTTGLGGECKVREVAVCKAAKEGDSLFP